MNCINTIYYKQSNNTWNRRQAWTAIVLITWPLSPPKTKHQSRYGNIFDEWHCKLYKVLEGNIANTDLQIFGRNWSFWSSFAVFSEYFVNAKAKLRAMNLKTNECTIDWKRKKPTMITKRDWLVWPIVSDRYFRFFQTITAPPDPIFPSRSALNIG